jgi:hypothetical protein
LQVPVPEPLLLLLLDEQDSAEAMMGRRSNGARARMGCLP